MFRPVYKEKMSTGRRTVLPLNELLQQGTSGLQEQTGTKVYRVTKESVNLENSFKLIPIDISDSNE
jgi:hypothetical protein